MSATLISRWRQATAQVADDVLNNGPPRLVTSIIDALAARSLMMRMARLADAVRHGIADGHAANANQRKCAPAYRYATKKVMVKLRKVGMRPMASDMMMASARFGRLKMSTSPS